MLYFRFLLFLTQHNIYFSKINQLEDFCFPLSLGADQAAFADDGTLILYDMTDDVDGGVQYVTAYSYDISSGHTVQTLEQTPYYRSWDENPSGVEIFGSHCVLIEPGGHVRAVDLKTGAYALLEGFTFHPEDSLQFNPSGTKLLYFAMNPEMEGLGISQIGVADLEKGVFFAFDRGALRISMRAVSAGTTTTP